MAAAKLGNRSHVRSWVIWGAWLFLGLGWELWDVFEEKKTGDEPLTRIARDRLMKNKAWYIAYPVRFICISFLGYLAFHWLGNVKW